MRGLVFDIQRFSIHDGPGIRTIVFLKGCPLRCKWCSNPESQRTLPEVMFNPEICIGCNACVQICPKDVINEEITRNRINREMCDGCGKCCEVCPTASLKLKGRYMEVEEVIEEIEKDRGFYQSSGGGVTVSGGEPLYQPEFLKKLLQGCKLRGLHTAVETTGLTQWENLKNILPYTDIFLYDIKHIDAEQHKKLTGSENQIIIENLKKLSKTHADVIIRIPVIPGYNDSKQNIKAVGQLAKEININEIHLLPYHNFGETKYDMLGLDYCLTELDALSEKDLEPFKGMLESLGGLKVNIGGE